MAHGVEEAGKAEAATKALFSGGGTSVTADDPNLPTTEIARADLSDMTLADAYVAAELAKGLGEARRLAKQGGLKVEDEKVDDVDLPFADVIGNRYAILIRAGKKRFKRIAIV